MFVVVFVYFHFVANVFEAPFISGHFVTANEKVTRDSSSLESLVTFLVSPRTSL